MKTIDEIKSEVAKECGEKHFDVLIQAELSIGDLRTARKLYDTVLDRFFNQFNEEEQ